MNCTDPGHPREHHPAVGHLARRLAAGDEELEVGLGLHRGERGVEDVELREGALVAGPGQLARDVVRRAGAVGDRVEAQGEPVLVVREQLVDPGVGRRGDGAVGGQQAQVGQAAHLGQRAEEVAQRLLDRHGLEADRRA